MNPVEPKGGLLRDKGSKIVDLFAGAGGASLGFVQAGFSPLFAIDFDKHATATYERNFGVAALCEDITLLDAREVCERFGVPEGGIDVLIGCPPCQGFSGMQNARGEGDPRNELLRHYLDFVEALTPRFTFFENVPGMMRSKHGRPFYEELIARLRKLGYGIATREVNAADFGTPQLRRRVIVLGARNGVVPAFPTPTHGDPASPEVRFGFLKPWVTVREAIGHFETPSAPGDAPPALPNHILANLGERVLSFLQRVPADGGSRTDVPQEWWLDCHRGHTGHKDVYGRMAWDRPSNTITTGCTNPSKGRFAHPEEHRAITPREAAALQGFPEDFVFESANLGRQIGNAVPPSLARAFAERIKGVLETSRYRAVAA